MISVESRDQSNCAANKDYHRSRLRVRHRKSRPQTANSRPQTANSGPFPETHGPYSKPETICRDTGILRHMLAPASSLYGNPRRIKWPYRNQSGSFSHAFRYVLSKSGPQNQLFWDFVSKARSQSQLFRVFVSKSGYVFENAGRYILIPGMFYSHGAFPAKTCPARRRNARRVPGSKPPARFRSHRRGASAAANRKNQRRIAPPAAKRDFRPATRVRTA